jgi:hypothetical protein
VPSGDDGSEDADEDRISVTKLVPYVSDETIERDAQALLAEYAHARGVGIEAPIPIDDIVEKHLKIGIEFDDLHRRFSVPRSGIGFDPDILGAIYIEQKRIVIDESLDPDAYPAMTPNRAGTESPSIRPGSPAKPTRS